MRGSSFFPKDVLRLILFSLEPLDMFCSVSGVCKTFWEISKEEMYWEREYGKRCSEKLKETLDRIELSKRNVFLFFILNNPLRILYNNEISQQVHVQCRQLIEYMVKSLDKDINDKHGCWVERDVFQLNDIDYYVRKGIDGKLKLVGGYKKIDYQYNILNYFGFRQHGSDRVTAVKKSSFATIKIIVWISLLFIYLVVYFVK